MAERGRSGLESSEDFYPVTPNDAVDLTTTTRELIIAVGGNIQVTAANGTTKVLTLPAGRFALRVTRVWSTLTTATGITAVV